jgi:hypothetical protein
MQKTFLCIFICVFSACTVLKKKKTVPVPPAAATVKQDSAKTAGTIKKYKDFVTPKTVTQKGLFTVHQTGDKFYFELPDSLMGRDIMVITRFIKVPANAGNYGGEELNEEVLRWEKGPANNLFLRAISFIAAADSTNSIYKAVSNSSLDPIVAAFEIKAIGKDSTSTLIDVTDFFKGESPLLSLTGEQKRVLGLGMPAADRSYIKSIRTFPINTEIRMVKTYPVTLSAPSRMPAMYTGALTIELNNSFILLPKIPMRKRLFDYRTGYFATGYAIYGDDQQEVKSEAFIHRWRLEPKAEDLEKWKRGELVEPQKPIVYYIDPATPKKWRPYLIAGINDWQKAFEQAGFRNAIVGKEWPENDTTMSLEDARYSVIRYFASDKQNAYGPNIADPRSGEIIESHVGWYHNVMKLVHDWYMIQAAAIDPRARKMTFDDELMGNLIRFVSSHEIGHTLGLRHNMGSSSLTPVEKLRDKAWVEAHGHTASIMDYARFNYVAQPEDSISEVGIFPRIGEYDKWTVQWGYSPILDTKDEEEDKKILNKWILDSLKANPRLWFSGEGRDFDPRSQTEDLSDNAMKAGEYGIKNLKRVTANLVEWTKVEGEGYVNLAQMYDGVLKQLDRYMSHSLKYIGGVYQTAKTVEQPGDLFQPAPKALQQEAVAFICRNMFQTPHWLLDKNILNKISHPLITDGEKIGAMQKSWLTLIISGGRLGRANIGVTRWGAANTITPYEILQTVHDEIWSELRTRKATDNFRRNLQKSYISSITALLDPANAPAGIDGLVVSMSASAIVNTDIKAIALGHITQLKKEVAAAIPASNAIDREHLQFVLRQINKALDDKKIESK